MISLGNRLTTLSVALAAFIGGGWPQPAHAHDQPQVQVEYSQEQLQQMHQQQQQSQQQVGVVPDHFSMILQRCETAVGGLARTLRQANIKASRGDLWGAAEQLAAGLNSVPNPARIAPPPHTVVAIESGREIVNNVNAAVNRIVAGMPQGQARRFGGRVKYYTFAKIYENILAAYNNLDARYFLLGIRAYCQGNRGCGSPTHPPYGTLPMEYFDGVRKLAQSFIELERVSGRLQGNDYVELIGIQKTAKASKNILFESVFVRDFSCLIGHLNNMDAEIAELIADQGMPWGDKTDIARRMVDSAAEQIARFACFVPRVQQSRPSPLQFVPVQRQQQQQQQQQQQRIENHNHIQVIVPR